MNSIDFSVDGIELIFIVVDLLTYLPNCALEPTTTYGTQPSSPTPVLPHEAGPSSRNTIPTSTSTGNTSAPRGDLQIVTLFIVTSLWSRRGDYRTRTLALMMFMDPGRSRSRSPIVISGLIWLVRFQIGCSRDVFVAGFTGGGRETTSSYHEFGVCVFNLHARISRF